MALAGRSGGSAWSLLALLLSRLSSHRLHLGPPSLHSHPSLQLGHLVAVECIARILATCMGNTEELSHRKQLPPLHNEIPREHSVHRLLKLAAHLRNMQPEGRAAAAAAGVGANT